MLEQWFADPEKLKITIGLKFDEEIGQNHPEVHESLEANNKGCCQICFMDFEDEDEYKAEQLSCGHQYNQLCWRMYL